jgi:hypothetical protein
MHVPTEKKDFKKGKEKRQLRPPKMGSVAETHHFFLSRYGNDR